MATAKRSVGYVVASTMVAAWMLGGPTPVMATQFASETRVRTMSISAARLLAYGKCRSTTIRALVAALDRSDVIFFFEVSLDPSIGQGRTSLVGASTVARFVHTQISARLSPDRQLEIAGHELRHATEIAGMPDVRDQKSLREGYVKIGWQLATAHDHETGAARETERQVKREIAGSSCPAEMF